MSERRPYAPRSFQPPAIEFIHANQRCAIWGTPGVGKTLLTLTALNTLNMAGLDYPFLIIAPKRVAQSVWTNEAAKWIHLQGFTVSAIVGTPEERLAALKTPADAYTINYENLVWLIDYWGDRWPYRTVVADESDKLKGMRLSFRTAKKKDGTVGKTFLAGKGAKRAAALARLAHLDIRRFIELTGTPSTNGLKDLWAQMWFLDRGERLGRSFSAFEQRWFTVARDGWGLEPRDGANEEIRGLASQLAWTIDAKDHFPLKEPVLIPIVVQLPPAARVLYREMERKFLTELEGRRVTAPHAGAKTIKLMQFANGAVYVDPLVETDDPMARKEWKPVHNAKIEALADLISELQGQTLIVVYQFWSDLQRLQKAFPFARHLHTKRDEDDFKAGKIQVLLLHPESAAYGIDGFDRVCHHMVFFGHSWNLAHYLQVVERIGPTRQYQSGMNRNVFLYFIVADNTIDEDVMERRESKKEVMDILMEGAKRRSKGLPSRWREAQELALEML